MKKWALLIGGIIGFVLGSRAGRGPYEQVESWVRQISGRPQVQRATSQVTESGKQLGEVARNTASTAVDRAAEATAEAANTAADRVTKTVQHAQEQVENS
jgi:methyl-accepting chemotaxis protein